MADLLFPHILPPLGTLEASSRYHQWNAKDPMHTHTRYRPVRGRFPGSGQYTGLNEGLYSGEARRVAPV